MSITLPVVSQPGLLLPPAKASLAKAMAATTPNSTGPSTGGTSSTSPTNLGSTFLNLLSTELRNQDPTAPVDSTAMVGQMISLNQLDQLIAINQTLTGTPSSITSTPKAVPVVPAATGSTNSAQPAAKTPALDPAAVLANAQAALPFDPNTLMPITPATQTTTSISGAK
jgi:flagellar basal-body rod modification protein FlgD